MTDKATIADILNNLITINKDRIVGYKEALHETKESQEKSRPLFKEIIGQSEHFVEVLKEKIKELGAEVTDKTLTTGLIYNTWMDIVYADAGKRAEIRHYCDEIEETTLHAYDAALIKMQTLDANIHDLILRQKQELINYCDQIKNLHIN